ncbi:type VII secretion system-associated protein [Streptomyces purpureus]|uniref:SseB protein N-terminal domain-containing protein n=1 Tax=Streptomyces purpureus TaxID=1951 RepID=A0A918HCF5_9ACTN|nr:type VII secretion system-associated protein [Streptomyces purpureus]GGT50332.1 hypothetical protein GCM10014713_50680 [Streptomyces purpureus]
MSETLLGSRDDATAVRGTERARCALRWWREEGAPMPYGVEAAGPWGSVQGRNHDLSHALAEVRRQLEAGGWLLAVNGARPDVRQSGMVAGSGTDRAYVITPGEPTDPEKMVGLFDDAPVEAVMTLADQDAAYRRLLETPMRRPSAREPSGPATPRLTDELRAQAKRAPGSWLYSIDPMYDPAGQVPPFAIIGAWPVNNYGDPGPFQHNPNYRPSPVSLGMPAPTDAVDAALQRAATGHGPDEAVVEALAAATVFLPDDGPDIAVYTDEQGEFVPVLTHPGHAPATVPRLRPVECAQLARLLPPEMGLKLNPGGRVSVRIPVSDVRATAERLGK